MEINDLPERYRSQAARAYEKASDGSCEGLKQESGAMSRLGAKNGPKRQKYGNKKIEMDGHMFDSKKEAEHYAELKLLERAGKISNLILQPRYELIPAFSKNGKKYRKTEYVADFQYEKDGEIIVVDVKGFRPAVYNLKKKMFEYRYPQLTIMEV